MISNPIRQPKTADANPTVSGASSSPTGFAAVVPPHLVGQGDYQLEVPAGVFLPLDEFRIQGLVVDLVLSLIHI